MGNNSEISITLLGTPQIYKNGTALRVSRKRVRALLYYLAAEGKPVSRSSVAYMLWPEKEYAKASQNLSIYLSYLKNELGEGAIASNTDMISLSAGVTTDIEVLRSLSDSADPNEMLDALKLYNGSFLSGFSLNNAPVFEQWVTETAAFWNRQYIEKATYAASTLIRKQRFEDALSLLGKAMCHDSLNEELCQLQMIALSRSGKRSAVTQVYQNFISLLNQELGLPPSQETSSCYQKIIASDDVRDSDATSTGAVKLTANQDLIFVGRQATLLSMAPENSNSFVLIQGKSGYGKTRLVETYIKRSEAFSLKIAFKHQEASTPYFGIIKLIRGLMLDPAQSERIKTISMQIHPRRREALCRLIPELSYDKEMPLHNTVVYEQQIMEAFEQFLMLLLDKQPTVIFIDDIHYADRSSLDLLTYLALQPSMENVRFFATFRRSLSHPGILAFLNSLQRENILHIIELNKLDDSDMLELLLYYYPDLDPETSKNLVELADGNPFWMRTIIEGLDSGYTELSGKSSLVNLFMRTLNSLSPGARNCAFALALLGESCDTTLFMTLCGDEKDAASEVFTELFRSNLISRDSDGNISFSHSKVYEYVLSCVQEKEHLARNLHLSIATAMESVYGKYANGQQLMSIADHFRNSSEPERCAQYASKAGSFLLSIAKQAEAVKYFKQAFAYLPDLDKINLLLVMYPYMMELGQNYEAELYMAQARELAIASKAYEYEKTFKAVSIISHYPEYLELYWGVNPCYSISVDRQIVHLLYEAKSLLDARSPNRFLQNHINLFLSYYYRLTGEFGKATTLLRQITIDNYPFVSENDINTNILLYFAIRDEISLVNQLFGESTEGIIGLASQLFESASLYGMIYANFGTQALLKNLHGDTEEGIRLMNSAISEARHMASKITLANNLVTQAMLLRNTSPVKSYSMNFEAYTIAKEINAKYTLARSLTGLVITSASYQDAERYYKELLKFAQALGNNSISAKLNMAARALAEKA